MKSNAPARLFAMLFALCALSLSGCVLFRNADGTPIETKQAADGVSRETVA